MTDLEKLELLKAALVVAAADGTIRRAELGVARGLAARVGVGQASFEAMVAAAERGEPVRMGATVRNPANARRALELLVAQARLDGEISDEERTLLVHIADNLNITGGAFDEVYRAGLARADALRKRGSA